MATNVKLSGFGMSHKKSHEVTVFSDLVAAQVNAAGLHQVRGRG